MRQVRGFSLGQNSRISAVLAYRIFFHITRRFLNFDAYSSFSTFEINSTSNNGTILNYLTSHKTTNTGISNVEQAKYHKILGIQNTFLVQLWLQCNTNKIEN
jgi:hypothetical protein